MLRRAELPYLVSSQFGRTTISCASINAPCADSVEYDMHMGLLELLKIFLARNPSADPTLPEVQLSNCVRIVSMMCTRLHPNHPR